MEIFFKDRFVDPSQPQVSVSDLGFLRGYGIFEFARSYAGHIFRLDDHLERFFVSASMLGCVVPYSKEEIQSLCDQLVQRSQCSDLGLKLILTGGVSESQFALESAPTFIIMAQACKTPASPLKVATSIYERHLPECKTLNYLISMREMARVQALKFDAPLFLDRHRNVLEGAKENVFAFKGDLLITPKEGILHGITRKVVMEMRKTQERTLSYDELMECDEVFFTSTVREIAPISHIDGKAFSTQKTQILKMLYGQGVSGKTKVNPAGPGEKVKGPTLTVERPAAVASGDST